MLGACLVASSKILRRCCFALAVELVDDLRPVDREELRLGLVGDGAGDQRLAAAGRAVEQHALGRVDAQALEDLGVAERQLDDLADAVQLALEPADVLVGRAARAASRRRLPWLLPGRSHLKLRLWSR